MFFMNPIP
jgi:hypothetical protein